jgi:hypothetical protein
VSLVVRCDRHPLYTGHGPPLRIPRGEVCPHCHVVQTMLGSRNTRVIQQNVLKPGLLRHYKIWWGTP